MSDSNGDADPYDDNDNTTTSASTRYPYTNDLLAFLLVLFLIGATAAYLYRGDTVPLWLATVDAFAAATATVWAFGKGAAKLARSIVGGGNE